jgi:hypothetical protein
MKVLLPGFVDRADVRLGNAVFNAYDRNGVAWIVQDIEGWWDLPEVNIPDDPRPFEQDGSYYTPGRYMPRTMTLTGTLVPPAGVQQGFPLTPTRDLAAYARQVLAASLDLSRSTAVLAVDEEVPKQAEVQLASRPSFRNSKINGATDFSVPLKAGDPRKYAQVESFITDIPVARATDQGRTYPRVYPLTYQDPGTPIGAQSPGIAIASNAGTYATGAIIRVYGPISTPSIENIEANSLLRFITTVPDGSYLEIDLLNRSVRLNGDINRRSTVEIRSKWFMLNPGLNSIRLNGDPLGGSPYMSIRFRSAWIY